MDVCSLEIRSKRGNLGRSNDDELLGYIPWGLGRGDTVLTGHRSVHPSIHGWMDGWVDG